jgi:thiamine-phosphate pyrophosphorylase
MTKISYSGIASRPSSSRPFWLYAGAKLGILGGRVAAGGATLVQLGDKEGDTRRLVKDARAIKTALAVSLVPLLINDRVDVALASGADGVHVGSDNMAPADARALLGREAIIGLSIKTIAQAEAAPVELVGYVCIGGVFATASKGNPDPPIGLAGLRAIWALMRARRGSPSAPSSALTLARDPSAAAREQRAIVDRAVTMRVDP